MEIWKDIIGYEGMYQVSNVGNVRSLDRLIKHYKGGFSLLKGFDSKKTPDKDGYLRSCLTRNGIKKTLKNHRLVALAFIPNPENKPQVNHINGIKTDNRLENLEWATSKENVNHSYKIGLKTIIKGEKHNQSRITEKDVLEIRASNLSNRQLELIYNIKANYIASIKRRCAWKHI